MNNNKKKNNNNKNENKNMNKKICKLINSQLSLLHILQKILCTFIKQFITNDLKLVTGLDLKTLGISLYNFTEC